MIASFVSGYRHLRTVISGEGFNIAFVEIIASERCRSSISQQLGLTQLFGFCANIHGHYLQACAR
jgi:hypothetical protein